MSGFCQALLQVCHQQPERIALEHENEVLSYQELANELKKPTGKSGFQILQGSRSLTFVKELLRCWADPNTVPLPLDPTFPAQRKSELEALLSTASSESVSYAITTSGSSGKPKVVLMSEEGLVPMLRAQIQHFSLTSESRCLWMLSPGFDASLSDIGVALLSGGTLVCAPCDAARQLLRLLKEKRITYLDMPPGLLEVYQPESFPKTLRTLVVGGAPSRPELLRQWSRKRELFVVYGPTEATVCSSLSRVDEEWDEPYIGQPIAQNRYRVVEGELQISGPALALGYLDQEATEQAFLEEEGTRWYRTGDLVEPTGSHHGLKFLGRADRQVKLRGQRIELEEIERRLWGHFGANRVAVVLNQGNLAVFWEGEGKEEPARHQLQQELPPAWQPSSWIRLSELPRTSSGKLDRTQLRQSTLPSQELDSLKAIERCLVLEQQGLAIPSCELLGRRTAVQSSAELDKIARSLLRQPTRRVRSQGRALLVTGSSGRLGKALLPLLDGPLLLLLRQPRESQHECLQGDVSQPNLGLSRADLEQLSQRVGAVLHLAGRLDLSCSLEELQEVNALSLLRLAELGAPIHHASTLACRLACQPRPRTLQPEASDESRLIFGGYAQSKWIAERFFESLPHKGWKFRYGQLLGDPQPDELLYQTVRGLLDLGVVPEVGSEEDLSFDFTPLEWAAEATAHWLKQPGSGPLHLSCGVSIPLAHFLQQLDLPAVPRKDFFEWTPPTPAASVAQRCLGALHPQPGGPWRDFDLLLTSGVDCLCPVKHPLPWPRHRVELALSAYLGAFR